MRVEECSKFFYIPSNEGVGGLRYIVDSDMNALYLIKKSGLPEEIRNQLVGGEAGSKEYIDYASLNDVYGVTSSLKVYYCESGLDTIKGLAKENLDKDNPNREVFPAGSQFADLIGKDGGPVTADDVKTVGELTLDSNSGITSLKDFYNLPNLKELILDGIPLDSLDGVQNCSQLNYVYFKNYNSDSIAIKDYSSLSGVKNLTYLYLLNSSNKQVADLCEGIKTAEFSKLENLRIMGIYDWRSMDLNFGTDRITDKTQSNLNDISGLEKLSKTTKEAVKNLYINNNKITDISCLSGFTDLYTIFMPNCNVKSFKGLENCNNLHYIYAYNNNFGIDETEELDETLDSLASLSKNTNLYYLDLINNSNLKNVGYLANCSGLKYLYLSGCSGIFYNEISKLMKTFEGCLDYSYDQKFSLTLTSENATKLDLTNLEVNESEFLALSRCTKLTYLKLNGTKFYKDNTKTPLTTEEINVLMNNVVSNFKNLVALSLYGQSSLTDGRFLSKLSSLKVLDVFNCGIATGTTNEANEKTGLENINNITTLKELALNNVGIDLSKIQPAISRIKDRSPVPENEKINSNSVYCFMCNNKTVMKTLENCDTLTNFCYDPESKEYQLIDSTLTLNLKKCLKLRYVEFMNLKISKVILPTNVENIIIRENEHCIFDFDDTSGTEIKLSSANLRYGDEIGAPQTIKNIGKCKNLTSLYLLDADNYLTELGSLSNCSKLNSIEIGGANWHNPYYKYSNLESLALLNVLQKLTKVTFNLVSNQDLNCLSNLENLTTINIDDCGFSDISGISGLSNLTNVTISKCKVSDISALSGLTSLTSLDLHNNSIANILPLENLKSLATLNLENNLIGDNFSGRSSLDILVSLHPNSGGKLKNLKLLGNLITNFDKLKALPWDSRSGF